MDKQPRTDLTYHVLVLENGRRQGIYSPQGRMPREGRVLLWVWPKDSDTWIVREAHPLDPPAADKMVQVKATTPVHWRLDGEGESVPGPASVPQDGTCTVRLPAAPGRTYRICADGKVIMKWRYGNGRWEEVP